MKVLVTGRNGQVATALAERAAGEPDEFVFVGRPEFDLADPASIRRAVLEIRPDVIVSAAAYTAVDTAEDEPERAHAINGVAPGVLAESASEIGARIVHLSTDYVFDGSGDRPRREDDPVGPFSVYGRTKLEGEEAVRAAAPESHVILRTAWVYSPFGNNFVKTMLRLAETRDELNVVDDQYGNPTSALDIADGIFAIFNKWRQGLSPGLGRTYHLAGSGEATWCELARAVFEASAARGGPSAVARPVPASAYPTKARRPANSRLDCSAFERDFGWRAPNWRSKVNETIGRLYSNAI